LEEDNDANSSSRNPEKQLKDPAKYVQQVGHTTRAGHTGTTTVFAYRWQLPIARKIMGNNKLTQVTSSFATANSGYNDDDDGAAGEDVETGSLLFLWAVALDLPHPCQHAEGVDSTSCSSKPSEHNHIRVEIEEPTVYSTFRTTGQITSC